MKNKAQKFVKLAFSNLITAAVIVFLLGCSNLKKQQNISALKIEILEKKAMAMLPIIKENYGSGGVTVFQTAVEGLKQAYSEGKNNLVSIEDMWTHALQEGAVLFNQPDKLWGPTTAEETADMLGQTTIGPWQITVWNVKDTYGPPYGLKPNLKNNDVIKWAKANPIIQARMIADYIQLSYETYGKRSPYAIQRYFWLEPFAKGESGLSKEWWKSPVAKPPAGKTWKDLTPEMIKDTGFYGKQIICGHPHQKRGLLYWLAVTADIAAIDDVLNVWKNEKKCTWDENKKIAVMTNENGNFELKPDDLQFIPENEINKKKLIIERMEKLSK